MSIWIRPLSPERNRRFVMAETPKSQTPSSPDNTHWGIAYLREDLQDIRLQMREDLQDIRLQMRDDTKELRVQIAETNKRIDETNKLLESRFIWIITTMVAIAGILIAVIKL